MRSLLASRWKMPWRAKTTVWERRPKATQSASFAFLPQDGMTSLVPFLVTNHTLPASLSASLCIVLLVAGLAARTRVET